MNDKIITFLIISIPIIFIIVFLIKRINYLGKYSNFLENEYFNFINLLVKSSPEQREKLLKKAQKTSLYRKIKYDNADMRTKFMMDFYNE